MKKSDLQRLIKKIIKEATSESGGRGSYILPLMPGDRLWDKSSLAPYNTKVSPFTSAELEYDSYDGQLSVDKKTAKKIEKKAKKISKYKKNHRKLSDDDGDVINPYPVNTTLVKTDEILQPYTEKGNWVKIDENVISEDLAVWFGTKKKPKGSKQPKGPWVNICKKIDGKHPPCGRDEASDKAYPKCRAAGVAGKMSDAEKKAACAQKRKAEKSHPKTGTGNLPKMVSYKPKQNIQKESLDSIIKKVLTDFV